MNTYKMYKYKTNIKEVFIGIHLALNEVNKG
ncbi:hypothetical protein SAMN05878482_102527 [Peribacillus simplex]|uniref:Uncharacterized protein n=1 Tax=Peribacillus simplex TaxID=1478 RepID=A0A9X8WJY6_9BACI|nr:hypothetical protein SAMN05878482_102527 [Peribacillus simplex]